MTENPVCPRCGMELLEWMITTNDEGFYKTFKFSCGTILHCNGDISTSILCDKRFLIERIKAIQVELEEIQTSLKVFEPRLAVEVSRLHLEKALQEIKKCH